MRTLTLLLALCLTLATTLTTSQTFAQGAPAAKTADTNADDATGGKGFWGIIFSGGIPGFLIIATLFVLSMLAAALVFEHVMTLRTTVLMPPQLAEQVRDLLVQSNVAGADQACRAKPSFLAFVLQAGVSEIESGWSAVEKAMEDAVAEQSSRLFRKVEYLSVIGNIAPMVGLIGTVVGMIFAFQQVAQTQGTAGAGDLAEGIYQALVTTVGGLLVAIPCLAAFAVFRNRVDQLVSESAYVAQHVFAPLKRRRGSRRAAATPEPPLQPPEGGAG